MGLMAMVFYLGKNYQSYQLEHLMLERETLVSRIEELETRNHNLVQKNAHLEGGSKIERDAYELANQELVRLQQELPSWRIRSWSDCSRSCWRKRKNWYSTGVSYRPRMPPWA
jgi:hypothetical protein